MIILHMRYRFKLIIINPNRRWWCWRWRWRRYYWLIIPFLHKSLQNLLQPRLIESNLLRFEVDQDWPPQQLRVFMHDVIKALRTRRVTSERTTDALFEENGVCATFRHVDEFCEFFDCRGTFADVEVEGKRWVRPIRFMRACWIRLRTCLFQPFKSFHGGGDIWIMI